MRMGNRTLLQCLMTVVMLILIDAKPNAQDISNSGKQLFDYGWGIV